MERLESTWRGLTEHISHEKRTQTRCYNRDATDRISASIEASCREMRKASAREATTRAKTVEPTENGCSQFNYMARVQANPNRRCASPLDLVMGSQSPQKHLHNCPTTNIQV